MKVINLLAVENPAGMSCGYVVTAGREFLAADFARKILGDLDFKALIPESDIREIQKAIDLSFTAVGVVAVFGTHTDY